MRDMSTTTTSRERMQRNTAPSVTERINRETTGHMYSALQDDAVDRRLAELDREWDVERLLFTVSGINALFGLILGQRLGRRWYLYTAAVAAFQVQHGVQGWCPPFALFRRFGVRTRREIDEERTALKAVRGDFSEAAGDPEHALDAAQA
jgi:hypothetical protein